MINYHFVWPAVHMPERGRETRLVPVALSSFISIREVYYLCSNKAFKRIIINWVESTFEI